MNSGLAHLLTSLYPRYWRDRYGEEFESFLQSGGYGLRTSANVVWSALGERVSPTPGLKVQDDSGSFRLQSGWLQSGFVQAPWAIFGLAPLLILAGAYLVACLILWSGWKFFLPETDTPFVRIDGLAIFYFGAGRLLYYGAPVLVGWVIGYFGARRSFKPVWPSIGLVLIALIGGTAQIHARHASSGGPGYISMDLAIAPTGQYVSDFLFHASVILSLTMVPYLIWRLQRVHSLPPGRN